MQMKQMKSMRMILNHDRDPTSFSGIVQTGTQHTLNGSQCAYTQNASSINDGIGANDVDDGHTTLYSPYYDMTNYNNPAFSYWRWYTNSPPSGANPGADWWQVSITDDGVNWQVVENNITSDISWRRFVFRAKDYVSLTSSQVQLKFVASDSTHLGQYLDGGSLVEAAIDDLYLWDGIPVTPSWDCDSQGNCSDPGTGLGSYSTLSMCQASCIPTTIQELNSHLLIYPNPAKNILTIDGDYTSATIYDVFGKVALTTDYQKTIDVFTLSSGIYFIHITTNHAIIVKKITIAK